MYTSITAATTGLRSSWPNIPDRLELGYGLHVTRGLFAGSPIVAVPVYIEQGGTVREIQARAAVPYGILRIDLQLLQMLGIQKINF